MNFSKQLKIYRETNGYSQEELAGKIYVTRQTISKWENDHTYPDIHNLIALSILFDVTLDELVRGDVEIMKNNIDAERMNKLSVVMLLFLIMTAVAVVPCVYYLSWLGLFIAFIPCGISMVAALKIEKIKKEKNIKTYAEIVAFTEGKDLDSIRKQRNRKRDIQAKVKLVLLFTLAGGAITALFDFLWFLILSH
ncbi:transcriptional regulator [Enterococcus sp. JM4C]|uniref:helix-turn-helix domain-containing protein n=1 Tax=Candidatus Enterococcus huntleyi TaxID=1857217 RepID=UPI001379D452|nr:helix-turn-helix transcriptional regulator [Enterococcus sp. JM4C]KAF1298454.1 transcriptional regulator [Enterococcus sp. JM4C]